MFELTNDINIRSIRENLLFEKINMKCLGATNRKRITLRLIVMTSERLKSGDWQVSKTLIMSKRRYFINSNFLLTSWHFLQYSTFWTELCQLLIEVVSRGHLGFMQTIFDRNLRQKDIEKKIDVFYLSTFFYRWSIHIRIEVYHK